MSDPILPDSLPGIPAARQDTPSAPLAAPQPLFTAPQTIRGQLAIDSRGWTRDTNNIPQRIHGPLPLHAVCHPACTLRLPHTRVECSRMRAGCDDAPIGAWS